MGVVVEVEFISVCLFFRELGCIVYVIIKNVIFIKLCGLGEIINFVILLEF